MAEPEEPAPAVRADVEAGEVPAAPEAPAAALARARATAAARGLRPGVRPRRRPADPQVGPSSRGVDRDPRLLGDQLESLVAERGWQTDVSAGAVMGRWAEVVGPQVAAHTAPVAFEAGVLTVRAESTAWATQLRLLTGPVLARIAETAGSGVVEELRVHGPSAPTWSRGPRRASGGRGPRDTYG